MLVVYIGAHMCVGVHICVHVSIHSSDAYTYVCEDMCIRVCRAQSSEAVPPTLGSIPALMWKQWMDVHCMDH